MEVGKQELSTRFHQTSVLPVTRDNRQKPENAFFSGFAEHLR
jgi:hypothetical protein